VLLDIARHQLHFEIMGIRLRDFIQPEKNRFETLQRSHAVDLLV
jgi:hypothetical protein